MTRKLKVILSLVMVTLFMVSTAVFAAVTFDPATGTGFVGKGDVQLALGLNNTQLQAVAESLAFTYGDEITMSQECERDGNKGIVTRTFQRERNIDSTVLYETRRNGGNGQVTGFNLMGYSGGTGGFTMPTDICPNPNENPAQEKWDPAGPVQIDSSTDGVLKVNGVALQ